MRRCSCLHSWPTWFTQRISPGVPLLYLIIIIADASRMTNVIDIYNNLSPLYPEFYMHYDWYFAEMKVALCSLREPCDKSPIASVSDAYWDAVSKHRKHQVNVAERIMSANSFMVVFKIRPIIYVITIYCVI